MRQITARCRILPIYTALCVFKTDRKALLHYIDIWKEFWVIIISIYKVALSTTNDIINVSLRTLTAFSQLRKPDRIDVKFGSYTCTIYHPLFE